MFAAVGIDLGTQQAAMAALQQGEPQALALDEGSPFIPAALAADSAGGLCLATFGEGQPVWDSGDADVIALPGTGRTYARRELAACYLAYLQQAAQRVLGQVVRRAVLAVPVAAGQSQICSLLDAAGLAGWTVLRVVRYPIASALAYIWTARPSVPHTLAVLGMGAQHLDVAILQILPGALTVLGIAGANWLGGEALTASLAAHLLRRLQAGRSLHLDDTRPRHRSLRRLLHGYAEQTKRALSSVDQVQLALRPEELNMPASLLELLSRSEYEEMVRPALEEVVVVLDNALAMAGLGGESVDRLLLLGGTTQMPLLRQLLAARLTHATPVHKLNPRLGAALGAALYAGLLPEVRCPICGWHNSLQRPGCSRCGASLLGAERLICPRCSLPNDPRRPLCWKCGASLRAAALRHLRSRYICPASRITDGAGAYVHTAPAMPPFTDHASRITPCITPCCPSCRRELAPGREVCAHCGALAVPFIGDIAPHTLSLEGSDGHLDPLLRRGAPIPSVRPVVRERMTEVDGQGVLECVVYEGERPLARDNSICARAEILLPPGLPSGTTVHLAFRLDEDGLLEVEASLGDGRVLEVQPGVPTGLNW